MGRVRHRPRRHCPGHRAHRLRAASTWAARRSSCSRSSRRSACSCASASQRWRRPGPNAPAACRRTRSRPSSRSARTSPSTSAASRRGATGSAGSRSRPSTPTSPRSTSTTSSTSTTAARSAPSATSSAPRSAVATFITALVFLLVMFVPCWLGIRLGATFATVLGIGTIVPLVLLLVDPPSSSRARCATGSNLDDSRSAAGRRRELPATSSAGRSSTRGPCWPWRRPPATSASAASLRATPRSR